jgi:hypothetical protein
MHSSTLIMLETQKNWYRPEVLSLGWQVGCESSYVLELARYRHHLVDLVWNLVGAIGFTLCGAFGYAADNASWAKYESSLSTFWGGWAFLIGSVIQWYESVNGV